MEMATRRESNYRPKLPGTARFIALVRPCPDDFSEKIVEAGRLGCEELYHVGRATIDRWMEECGKQELITARAAKVAKERKEASEKRKRLNRSDMRKLLREAYRPRIRDRRKVPVITVQQAAQYLRILRNGGFVISPCPNGDWRIGTRIVSPAQLLDIARAKGF